MANEKDIVRDGRATAEDLAKKVEEVLKENLVGFTQRQGSVLTFTLVDGQRFTVEIKEEE